MLSGIEMDRPRLPRVVVEARIVVCLSREGEFRVKGCARERLLVRGVEDELERLGRGAAGDGCAELSLVLVL